MEENKEQPQEEQQQDDIVARAEAAAERLEAAEKRLAAETKKLERLRIQERLGGQSDAGHGEKKEISNAEYAKAALAGKVLE